jgi:MFS family permease
MAKVKGRTIELHDPEGVQATVRKDGPYAWYVVFVLAVVYSISFIDRQMLSLLIGPIRKSLHISDTQIGLLTGFAFAGLYAILGIPLGRLADSRNRVRLIAAGMTVWSFATAACGLAQSFGQLFAARVAVGVGEASLTPAAYSLFANYFSQSRLGRAIAAYTLAMYAGMGLTLVAGGLLVHRLTQLKGGFIVAGHALEPWQLAMMCVAIPGLLVLPLVLTLNEPRRDDGPVKDAVNLRRTAAYLASNQSTYLPHFIGFGLAGLYATGLTVWLPEFFHRSYGWAMDRTGLAIGVALICVGGPSTLLGGYIADRLRARAIWAAPMQLAAICMMILCPLVVALPMAPTGGGAFGLLCAVLAFLTLPTAVAPAALQLVTPSRMRGRVTAAYMLFTNLVGSGAGPLVVGLVTDHVFHDENALKLSLTVVGGVVCGLSALVLWRGAAAFGRLAALSADDA